MTEPTAVQLRADLEAGKITAREVTDTCLARIAADEERVQAWQHLDPDHARAQADALDAAKRAGRPLGALHGLPVGVKDIIDTYDFPTEHGSPVFAGRRPAEDAWIVQRLRQAGAVILGKTVTTEFAAFAPGKTRNPHDVERTPGGSSSGSAAAVAAGMVPLALGSQTNGSVIRPAAFCGTVGYKPSFGSIPRTGMLTQASNLDHVGVFARSLEDAGLLAQTLFGFDPADPATRMEAAPRLQAAAGEPLRPAPRLGLTFGPARDLAETTTVEAFQELAEHLGAQVVALQLPASFDRALAVHRVINTAEIAYQLGLIYDRHRELVSPQLEELVLEGRAVSAIVYQAALAARDELRQELHVLFREVDAILTPSAAGEAPLGLGATGSPAFCTPWTLCGVPAITLPILAGPGGLPMGAQLVADFHDDVRLFRVASWLGRRVAEGEG